MRTFLADLNVSRSAEFREIGSDTERRVGLNRLFPQANSD